MKEAYVVIPNLEKENGEITKTLECHVHYACVAL
jgi:hypothetical protein